MPWNVIELESLNMRKGTALRRPGAMFKGGMTARANNDCFPVQDSNASFGKRDFDSFRSDEASRSHDNLHTARLEIRQVHVDKSVYHFAFTSAHARHIDFPSVLGDAELLASRKVRSDLRALNDVFAWETSDVGTGTSDVFPFNDDGSPALFGQSPGDVLACLAATQHDEIIRFRI